MFESPFGGANGTYVRMMLRKPHPVKNGVRFSSVRNESCELKVLFWVDLSNEFHTLGAHSMCLPVVRIKVDLFELGLMSAKKVLRITNVQRIIGRYRIGDGYAAWWKRGKALGAMHRGYGKCTDS